MLISSTFFSPPESKPRVRASIEKTSPYCQYNFVMIKGSIRSYNSSVTMVRNEYFRKCPSPSGVSVMGI